MKVVALCKTWRGHEFLPAMIESIYNQIYKIVFVHSEVSWDGEYGNTVIGPVETWKAKNDYADRIISINFDSQSQNEQYKVGFDYIKANLDSDFTMLIDTDEVWDSFLLEQAIYDLSNSNPTVNAFCTDKLFTYIKSPFYRVEPLEPLDATVFIRNKTVSEISGVRGNGVYPRISIPNIRYHHFTDVRMDSEDVFKKIILSNKADGAEAIDIKEWKRDKWDKLPFSKNLHHSKGYESNWGGIQIVTKADLPHVFTLYNHPIIRMFELEGIDNVVDRHKYSYEIIKSNQAHYDIEANKSTLEFTLLKKYLETTDKILEVGCLMGRNLIGLAQEGFNNLTGVEFLTEAVSWGRATAAQCGKNINFQNCTYGVDDSITDEYDKIILFDVLEHIPNVENFLLKIKTNLKQDGDILLLVPKADEYHDKTHINFYPDIECLHGVITKYFNVVEYHDAGRKLFMRCKKYETM
jgi:2-polyprenyl-3-methyl-5-hydroxy-6-metoxy-1,4-benzoquinol methylase